ncbi:hypothetical protein MTR_4g031950 [Medicago truncatula]|uniref:Uncharacterized protein n=1 Tax=Medicago truncatula TaxID=3880 RepID=G7JM30_MEDTR|nr:hypothetical protein MTR_4g031950 [Medicago truncatula]
MFLKRTGVPLTRSAKACIDQKILHSIRHILPGVKPGFLPGAHLPGAKALAFSFATGVFAGDYAHGKHAFAKAFCILLGLSPLAKCNISCSDSRLKMMFNTVLFLKKSILMQKSNTGTEEGRPKRMIKKPNRYN